MPCHRPTGGTLPLAATSSSNASLTATGKTTGVFTDPRFRLATGPDEVLLGFLAQMVHPVVQPDAAAAARIVADLNRLLAPDGWMLKPHRHLSGRPVYRPARTGTVMAAVGFAHQAAARIDAEYVSQQVTRMEGAADTGPDLAIGTARSSSRRSARPSWTNGANLTTRVTTCAPWCGRRPECCG